MSGSDAPDYQGVEFSAILVRLEIQYLFEKSLLGRNIDYSFYLIK